MNPTSILRNAIPLLALLSGLVGQSQWLKLSPATAPTGRAGTIGVSDGSGLLMFGGNQNPTLVNELWRFDGTTWANLTPASGPMPGIRDFYAAAYDSGRGKLVVFGGRDQANVDYGDVWEWDGATWTQRTFPTLPSARRWAAMTYDPVRARCVLFGGFQQATSTYLGDTWTYDGTTWTQLAPATTPAIRARSVMTFRMLAGEVLMFGGRNAAAAVGETWAWNGTTWRQVTTATIPGGTGLYAFGMTYDLLRDRVLVFGGTTTGATLATTWEFDGTDWRSRTFATTPASRTGCALAFVIGRGKSYLYGGFDTAPHGDTWELQTNALAGFALAGAGCGGAAGVPALSAGTLPWIGTTFQVRLGVPVTSAPALLVLGAQPAQLSLAVVGAPGCTLLASPDVALNMATSGSTAALGLPIPSNAALLGGTVYLQGAAVDPGANGLGVAFSARGDAKFGAL